MSGLFSILAMTCSVAAVLLVWAGVAAARWAARTVRRAAWRLGNGARGLDRRVRRRDRHSAALESAAIVAFVFILSRIEFRTARGGRERYVVPPERSRHAWLRGTVRGLGAGPIGFGASVGIGVLFATAAPLEDATRLILAGLLVPSLWGAAMIWVLASRRVLLPSAGLLGIAVATIGTSILVARRTRPPGRLRPSAASPGCCSTAIRWSASCSVR